MEQSPPLEASSH